MRSKTIQRAILVVSALGVAETRAATLRVPSEYATINQGLDAAAAGDTVIVAPGEYASFETRIGPFGEPVSSCAFLKGNVVLASEAGPTVTTVRLDGAAGFPFVMFANQITEPVEVRGFTITSSLTPIVGINLGFSNVAVVEDCVIRDIGAGSSGDTGLVGPADDLVLRNCQFRDIRGDGGSALKAGDANVTVQQCVFQNCDGTAMTLGNFGPGSSSKVTLRESRFVGNWGTFVGAISVGDLALVTIAQCWFSDNVGSVGAVDATAFGGSIVIEDNTFLRNHAIGGGGAMRIQDGGTGSIVVRQNTIHACSQDLSGGGAAILVVSGVAEMSANVITASVGTAAVGVSSWPPPGGQVQSDCNVFWENEEGDVEGVTLGPNDQVVDPLYCDPAADNYTVASNSPCLPQNSGPCGQIGAYGEGCAAVSVEPTSWGEIKGRFRD